MKTLKELKVGESGKIVKVGAVGDVKRRFMDMGITRGVTVKVIKIAPLGDPIEIEVRGYNLSVRKDDASKIDIEVQA